MKNNSSEYWAKRFKLLEESQNKIGLQCYVDIERQYQQAQRHIEGQIARWYTRFADNNGVTMAQAKKLLTGKQLEEFKWDVHEYIRYGQENAINGQWVKELENASARYHISRLQALKIQMQQQVEVLFGNQLDSLDTAMRNIYARGYNHTAFEFQKGVGVGWSFAKLDENKINKVINKPWAVDGKNFSERVWGNRQKLINELNNEITRNIILGEDPQKAIDAIAKKMNTSKHNAGRLVMTEEAFFSSAAQRDCFKELDVEEFEIVAVLDSHTSDTCQNMDGQHFPMSEWEVGVTAPPFHVWCRSTTVPYFEDDFGSISERAARDTEGQTYHVPANMTYKEWEKAFVEGDTAELEVKQTRKITKKDDQNEYSVDRKLVNSKVYHDKFEGLLKRKAVNESIYQVAMKTLEHRDGTGCEDLVALNALTGNVVVENTLSAAIGKTGFTLEQYEVIQKFNGDVILLHNHPNSSRPSFADIKTLFDHKFVNTSVIIGHDGSIHMITSPNRTVDIDSIWEKAYNYYLKKYQNRSVAEHKALDLLYKSDVFVYESR